MPSIPAAASASFTSSSLNGLMMATMSFMRGALEQKRVLGFHFVRRKHSFHYHSPKRPSNSQPPRYLGPARRQPAETFRPPRVRAVRRDGRLPEPSRMEWLITAFIGVDSSHSRASELSALSL